MGETELHQENFEININLGGANQTINVNPEETTDGVEYFKCSLAGKNLTQVRREEDGNWEQIWGDLDMRTVEAIGKAIAAHTL